MDERLVAEILATCDSIGYSDDTNHKYVKDPHALECVKDLVLYLRRDDDDHSVRRLLGRAGVVCRDLLPLLAHYAAQDLELFDVILRLLVNLTHPALLLYEEEVPKNKKYLSYYMEIDTQLRQVKEAFVDKEVWMRLADRLRTLLNLDWEKRMEDDRLALERILVLTRNVLTVAADTAEEMRTDDEASLHDRLLMVIHLSGLEDLLLFIASSDSTKEYCLHVLEIISVMMRDTGGETLARTDAVRNEEDRVKDSKELNALLHKERELKKLQVSSQATTRHSRFGGTFCVQGIKGASGRELLCHKPIKSTADLSLDATKKAKKKPSNRTGMKEESALRRSTVPVRLILKEFCAEFLDNAYNSIMATVKDNIVRGRMQDHDETYYLWAMKFFMEFNRFQKEFRMSHVSETMSTAAFHYVQTLLDTYHSMMITDKDKLKYWSKRAHMALKAYQELLYTLLWMDSRGSRYVRESSRVIKSNVFYLPEYRELCLGLLNSFDSVRLSKSYLIDLVETNHLFLKMLEDFSKGQGKIIIKTKGKKRARKSKKNESGKKKRLTLPDEDELAEAWDGQEERVKEELSKVKEGDDGPSVIPFDAASDVPIDDQKNEAIDRVAVFLHTGRVEEAVALLRNSREVWPEAVDAFGAENEEVQALKDIYISKGRSLKVMEARNTAREGQVQEEDEEQRDEDEEEEEEDEEEEIRETSKEMEFDFFSFLLKYASPKVVSVYGRLWVEEWEALQPRTIHAVLRFFHRLVFQMDYPALLAQVSLFKAFQRLLIVAPYDPKYKDAAKFFLHFWPKFISLVEKRGSIMWVEALFWKSGREALEIQEGCQSSSTSSGQKKPRRGDWSEDDIEQLKLLVEEFETQGPNEEEGEGRRFRKSKEKRLLEFVSLRWTGINRSSKAFKNKLIELEMLAPTEKKMRPPKEWSEEEADKLRAIWGEVKVEWWDADRSAGVDVMERVLGMLGSGRGRANVVAKMVELGLIRHKNEVGGGKRNKKEDAKEPTSREFIEEEDSSTSEDESGGEEEANDKATTPNMEEAVEIGRDLVKKGVLGDNVRKWVAQSLQYFLEDLDDGEGESVPLVPIAGEAIAAVAKTEMKTFFRAMGLMAPGQGEAFWRIPGTWNTNDVKGRIKIFEDIENGVTGKEEGPGGVSTSEEPVSPKAGSKSPRSDTDDDSASEVSSLTSATPSSKGPSQRSRKVSSSDDEIETTDVISQTDLNTSRRRNRRIAILDSDDEDSSSKNDANSPEKDDTSLASADLSDSPTEADNKQNLIIHTIGTTKKRKRVIVDSDSE